MAEQDPHDDENRLRSDPTSTEKGKEYQISLHSQSVKKAERELKTKIAQATDLLHQASSPDDLNAFIQIHEQLVKHIDTLNSAENKLFPLDNDTIRNTRVNVLLDEAAAASSKIIAITSGFTNAKSTKSRSAKSGLSKAQSAVSETKAKLAALKQDLIEQQARQKREDELAKAQEQLAKLKRKNEEENTAAEIRVQEKRLEAQQQALDDGEYSDGGSSLGHPSEFPQAHRNLDPHAVPFPPSHPPPFLHIFSLHATLPLLLHFHLYTQLPILLHPTQLLP